MECKGIHCPGCGHGGSGIGAGVLAVIVSLAVAAHFASAIGRAVSEVVFVLAVVAGSIAGIAVTAGAVVIAVRLRHGAARRAQLQARELARAETLAWTLAQIAARDGRASLPAAPGASLAGHGEHIRADARRFPR